MNAFRKAAKRALKGTVGTHSPSLMVIGTQKGGTTAMFEYLRSHPGVAAPTKKELNFFSCICQYDNGIDYYRSLFPIRRGPTDRRLSFEASPHYMTTAAISAGRIAAFDPTMRFVAVLRDPATRAYSAWQMYQRVVAQGFNFDDWVARCEGPEAPARYQKRSDDYGRSFAEDIQEELDAEAQGIRLWFTVLPQGRYRQHLANFREHFTADQLLVLESEEFRTDTVATLRQVETFAGLEPHSWATVDLSPSHVGGYGDPIPADARELLSAHYAVENEGLEAVTGRTFSWN